MTKSKNKGGRPSTKLNDEQIKEAEDMAANGMTCEQIANYFGIGETTFLEIRNRDSKVSEAYKKGKAAGVKRVTGMLWEKIQNGDTTSIIFFLKTQAGWSEKNNLNLTSEDGSMSPKAFKVIFEEEKVRNAI